MERDEALQILETHNIELYELLSRLDEAGLVAPGTIGGGDWSAKDLLAHVAFWEELALAALTAWRAGETTPFRDTDEVNAENQAASAGQSLEEVFDRAASAHTALVGQVELMEDAEWSESRRWGDRDRTLGELLGGITAGKAGAFDHVNAHLADLEAYVAQSSRA